MPVSGAEAGEAGRGRAQGAWRAMSRCWGFIRGYLEPLKGFKGYDPSGCLVEDALNVG